MDKTNLYYFNEGNNIFLAYLQYIFNRGTVVPIEIQADPSTTSYSNCIITARGSVTPWLLSSTRTFNCTLIFGGKKNKNHHDSVTSFLLSQPEDIKQEVYTYGSTISYWAPILICYIENQWEKNHWFYRNQKVKINLMFFLISSVCGYICKNTTIWYDLIPKLVFWWMTNTAILIPKLTWMSLHIITLSQTHAISVCLW